MKRIFPITLILFLLWLPAAVAETWVVPGDYATMTEAVEQAAPGDTVLLTSGVYGEDKEIFPIVIDKPLTIIGQKNTILESPRFATLLKITSDDVSIRAITFNVRKWGIVASSSKRMTVEGCTFVLADEECRTSSTAIWMEGMKHCTLKDCAFEGVGVCVGGDPLNENSAGKPVLTGLCEIGEDLEYFTTHTVEGCTVNGKPLYYRIGGKNVIVPEDAGGLIAACCDGITVRGVDVSGSSMGLEIVHSKNVTLDHVTADRCGIFGTYVACCEGGTFNQVQSRFTNHGIDTRACNGILVKNCLTEDCDQGIFYSLCRDCVTEDCTARRSGFAYFAASGHDNIIRNCSFEDNADGIYLQNENTTTIENCRIIGSTVVGLRVLKSSCFCSDTTMKNGWTGSILYDARDTTLSACKFAGNASANLYLANIHDSRIINCTFTGTTKAHLEIEGISQNSSIQQCTFSGDDKNMLLFHGESMPDMTDNHFH